MSYNKKRLAELFKCIYQNTTDISEHDDRYRKMTILVGAGSIIQITNERGTYTCKTPEDGGQSLRIYNDGVDAIEKFIEELHKDEEIRIYVSRQGIEKQIEDALRNNYQALNNDDYESFVKEKIIKPIRANIKDWEVYVPLVNMKIENELVLGDISFIPNDIAAETINKFMANGNYLYYGVTNEEIEDNKKAFLGQISQTTDGYHAFAKVACKSHYSNLEAVAINKAHVAINTIRAFLHILTPPFRRALWGLPQEVTSGLTSMISLDYSESHNFHLDYIKSGAITIFVLGEKVIGDLWAKCHFEVIQDIFKKPPNKRTCLENVIITALQAIGKAIIAPSVDMRFMGYIIAIERLLIKDGEDSTTEKFTDRLSLTLTNDITQRMILVKRTKELYNKRSKMVHAASFFDIYEEDEYDAENWALNLVIMVLGKSKEGYTHQKLCDEISNKKYTG